MNPENMKAGESVEFLWRRLTEECPNWAIFVPVLFAFIVVGLVAFLRPERKLMALLVVGAAVGAISLVYLPLAFLLLKVMSWLVVLVPVVLVAMFYVVLMYIRDSRSVHWLWAIFLGMLRTSVYLILAVVFMLPGCQHFEKQEYESKVLFLIDVSGSHSVVDDLPQPGQDRKELKSRQEKVLDFLTSTTDANNRVQTPFMDRVVGKSPVTFYRFGPVLDEADILNFHQKTAKNVDAPALRKFAVPNKDDVKMPNVDDIKDPEVKTQKLAEYAKRIDMVETLKSGTNIGGSALQMLKLENNSFVQAIVIISDGQSNVGSDEARTEFLARVTNPKRAIPVITIGVGQFRLPASIRIDDLQAPEETRPDDRFPVRVPVVGTGLHDEVFNVTLTVTRVKDVTGKPLDVKEVFELGPRQGKFKGAGDHPQDLVEFEVDVQELKKIKAQDDKNADLEGEWHIVARVPRNAKEATTEKEHVTEPTKVQIQKRALRVLLFAGGATREYQFLRTIIYREMVEKRMEMCIFNQSTAKEDHIDQDVSADRLLDDFPSKVGPAEKPFMSLSDHDVVICFDPDWSKLRKEQKEALKEWVTNNSGGIIFVAGPVYSFQLARPGAYDVKSILEIYPVVPLDSRTHGLSGIGATHDSSRPYAFNFSPTAKQNFEFLKLDEAGDNPIAGWNGFFFNDEKFSPEMGKDYRPKRGFFTYYPVERVKPATQVAAVIVGPKENRIGDKTDAFKDMPPFIATMPVGSGKSVYLGSGEFWRLRAYKDGFHDRFWIKLARFASAGAQQQKAYGRMLLPRSLPVGVVNVEAQVKGKDKNWLPMDVRPTVLVKRIDKNRDEKEQMQRFDLQAKPVAADETWRGNFMGSIHIKEPGEYEFQLPIPGTTESLRQNLIVRKPNPELDNVRTNFGLLYNMASPVDSLKSLPAETRKKIEQAVQMPADAQGGTTKRLFFPLASADSVSDCIQQVQPRSETTKGRYHDLWDKGVDTGFVVNFFWTLLLAPLIVGLIGLIILAIFQQWLGGILFFLASVVVSVLAVGFGWYPMPVLWVVGMALTVGLAGAGVYLLIKQEYFWGVTLALAGMIAAGFVIYGLMHASDGFINTLAEAVREGWLPLGISFFLTGAVGLLALEWLTRKLLRLA